MENVSKEQILGVTFNLYAMDFIGNGEVGFVALRSSSSTRARLNFWWRLVTQNFEKLTLKDLNKNLLLSTNIITISFINISLKENEI